MSRIVTPGSFDCCSADPPWPHQDKLPGKGRGAEKHYRCLSIPEIIRFPLPPLADDCWLFLWRVGCQQQEALNVATSWGFRVISDIPWVKVPRPRTPKQLARKAASLAKNLATVNGEEVSVAEMAADLAFQEARRVRIAMGRSVRNAHESCLVCKRGRPLRADAGVPSVIFGESHQHSAKPEEFYRLVERLVGPSARKVELFARRTRPGWVCLGDEVQAAPAAEGEK